ncbi:MAG: 50S ribosomal protein L25 [Thermodesulfobacteriota bacterium]
MIQIDVTAQLRDKFGKGAARTIRRDGRTPAILYGPKTDPMALTLDTHSFTKSLLGLQRRNAVISLDIEGDGQKNVMVKDIQVDPVNNALKHADFYELDMDNVYTYSVPVVYTGKAKGLDTGGDMQTYVNSVDLKGKPLNIPDSIEVDVTPLQVDDKITLAELAIPEGVTLLGKAEAVCVAVLNA